jgi:hypothetical protein
MENQPRRPGRPRHNADQVKRVPLNLRTTTRLKAALAAVARLSGRSLVQEIEWRLWASLQPARDRSHEGFLLDRLQAKYPDIVIQELEAIAAEYSKEIAEINRYVDEHFDAETGRRLDELAAERADEPSDDEMPRKEQPAAGSGSEPKSPKSTSRRR